jgi:hypothetical protein
MNRLIVFLLLTVLTGCGCCDTEPSNQKDAEIVRVPMTSEEYTIIKEIAAIIINYDDMLQRELNVYLDNSYAFPDEETSHFTVWMDFHTQESLDVAGGRRMMVRVVEGLLERLNNDPWLSEYAGGSFTPRDLYISIELTSYHGKFIDPLLVGRIELCKGLINCYYAHDAIDPTSVEMHMHFEPYESARFFVEQEDLMKERQEADPPKKDAGYIRARRDKLLGWEKAYPSPLP